jgi:hypothetical protein
MAWKTMHECQNVNSSSPLTAPDEHLAYRFDRDVAQLGVLALDGRNLVYVLHGQRPYTFPA